MFELGDMKNIRKQPRVTIRQFMAAIERGRSDRPVIDPDKWYLTQKEHWLGWLDEYNRAGAYGRITGMNRDARFSYNHIVEPKMLLWLISAAGVSPSLIRAARRAAAGALTMNRQSGLIRAWVPWAIVAAALWSPQPGSRAKRRWVDLILHSESK